MRLVSNIGKYGRQYRPRKVITDVNGVETVTQEGVYLYFQQEDVRQNEIEQAVREFNFKGQFQHEGEAAMVDPAYRISTFDTTTQGWSDELRSEVEAWLEEVEPLDPDFFIVRTTPIPRPFPNYDEFAGTPEKLLAKLREDGYDLPTVLNYEREYGPNRAKVVQALEQAVTEDQVEVVPA